MEALIKGCRNASEKLCGASFREIESQSNDGSDVSQLSLGGKIQLIALHQRRDPDGEVFLDDDFDSRESKPECRNLKEARHLDEQTCISNEERDATDSEVSEEVPKIIASEKTNFQFRNEEWKHLLQRNNELLSKLSGSDFPFLLRENELQFRTAQNNECKVASGSDVSLSFVNYNVEESASQSWENIYSTENCTTRGNDTYFVPTGKPLRPLTPVTPDCILEDISEETSQADLDSLPSDSRTILKESNCDAERKLRDQMASNNAAVLWQKHLSSTDAADNRDTSATERSLLCSSFSTGAKNSSESSHDIGNNSTQRDSLNSIEGTSGNFPDNNSTEMNSKCTNKSFERRDSFDTWRSEVCSEIKENEKIDVHEQLNNRKNYKSGTTAINQEHNTVLQDILKSQDVTSFEADASNDENVEHQSKLLGENHSVVKSQIEASSSVEVLGKIMTTPTRNQFLSQKNAIEKLVLEKAQRRKELQESVLKASSGTQTTSSDSGSLKNNETEDPASENELTHHKKSGQPSSKTLPELSEEQQSVAVILDALLRSFLSIKTADLESKKALRGEKDKLQALQRQSLRLCLEAGCVPHSVDWPELHETCRRESSNLRIKADLCQQKNLDLIRKLLDDKKTLTEDYETVKKELTTSCARHASKIKVLEDQHRRELLTCKQKIVAAEQTKREKWTQHKTKLIKESSFRGLETRIKNLLSTHRDEISKLKAKHWQEMRSVEQKAFEEQRQQEQQLRQAWQQEKQEACRMERESAKQRLELELQRSEQIATERALAVSKAHAAELAEKKESHEREVSALICEHRAQTAHLLSEAERVKLQLENTIASTHQEYQGQINCHSTH
ncbi:reticulocyte-binding protein homolog 2a-like [Hyalella azteca]|uniref:Reticulocyte-binding protein homolog 2a-like n=1 Tax=Hyalella azteca TaxID=294128 RepID=A0A979FI60_HYAAZ|nr:reticulocyte-binding protein homolog 2a-like [Hyalella azteca]